MLKGDKTMFDFLFNRGERNELINWILEHDNSTYHGHKFGYNYKFNEQFFVNYSVDKLKLIKESMIAKHNQLEYEKSHPKPKIGETYYVYICGKHVDTLYNVTNVSSNSNGVYFTSTNEDGTTRMKEYFGTGQINWTKV